MRKAIEARRMEKALSAFSTLLVVSFLYLLPSK